MDIKMFNYMETAVGHYLEHLLRIFPDQCTCPRCLLDIQAIALNNLKPHYIVLESGKYYERVEAMNVEFESEVLKALMDAINLVHENPRHEPSSREYY